MPVYLPRNELREIRQPRFRNSYWENWGPRGLITGFPLVILGITISITEIIRIIYGVTNRGIRKPITLNFHLEGTESFMLVFCL